MRVTANKNSIRTTSRKYLALFIVLVSGLTITGCSSQASPSQNQPGENQSQTEAKLYGPRSVNCDGILEISREPYRILVDISGPWLESATSEDVQGVLRAKGFESFQAFREYLQDYRGLVVSQLNSEPDFPQVNFIPELDKLQALNIWLQDEGKTGQDLNIALQKAGSGFENLGDYCSGMEQGFSSQINGELPSASN